jgi:hypothetical protein
MPAGPAGPRSTWAGIASHLAGGTVLLAANKGRVAGQQGVSQATAVKTGLTVLALGATAWARVLGAKLNQAGEVPVEGGTDPSGDTPEDVAKAQQLPPVGHPHPDRGDPGPERPHG